MECKICGNFIVYDRSWMNIFIDPNYQICNDCYKKYPINIACDIIKASNTTFRWYHLFKKEYDVKSIYFLNELSRLVKLAIDNNKGIILYFEFFPRIRVLELLGCFDEMVNIITVFG